MDLMGFPTVSLASSDAILAVFPRTQSDCIDLSGIWQLSACYLPESYSSAVSTEWLPSLIALLDGAVSMPIISIYPTIWGYLIVRKIFFV
jgi:hypothetical protein